MFNMGKLCQQLVNKNKEDGLTFYQWFLSLQFLDKNARCNFVCVDSTFNYRFYYDENKCPNETFDAISNRHLEGVQLCFADSGLKFNDHV